jgi:hypothetical protein
MVIMKICTVPGCEKPLLALGFCAKHWERNRRHGSPYGGRTPNGEAEAFINLIALTWQSDECLLWPYGTSVDYGWLSTRAIHAHRYICEKIHGPPPFPLAEACHTCNRRLCVNHRHLYWGTHKQNMGDVIKQRGHGPNNKLEPKQVLEIRALYPMIGMRILAGRFDVTVATIWNVVTRKTWKHL